MKFKIISILAINLMLLVGVSSNTSVKQETKALINQDMASISINCDKDILKASDSTLTVQDMADYLNTKSEHYPFSDEFVEKYQQSSGGYIDNAKRAGLVVDKQLHEPNQKWHFFESWLYPSIEDETLSMDDSAYTRIYAKLQCPELLLWIYEACEVSPSKIRDAKVVAEQGEFEGLYTSTIAKNMRAYVPWEDIEETVLNFLDSDKEKYNVTCNSSSDFSISGLNTSYYEDQEVSFSIQVNNEEKEIDNVKINDELLSPLSGTNYKFNMPNKDVHIEVLLKEKEVVVNPPVGENSSAKYDIKYEMEGSRSKAIEDPNIMLDVFDYVGEESGFITSVSELEKMYGGGYGTGDYAWVSGDMIKFGTTSVNGSLTLALNTFVHKVKITGYVYNASCKVQIGDSTSSDWLGESSDNKTSTFVCSDMNIANKDNVENKLTSTFEVDFASTNTLKISTINKKPLFITNIEFFN